MISCSSAAAAEPSVGSGSGSEDQYVAAPLVPVDTDGNQGAYSFWIGDEGVKSRINMERLNEAESASLKANNIRQSAVAAIKTATLADVELNANTWADVTTASGSLVTLLQPRQFLRPDGDDE